MPWSPISVDQCPFVLGLSDEDGELLLDQGVQVTEGHKTKDMHLFLFDGTLVFAKLKSSASFRLKHRRATAYITAGVSVAMELFHFLFMTRDGKQEAEGVGFESRAELAMTIRHMVESSPGLKERWLDTLNSKITEARATSGAAAPTPHALMKVLSGNIANKTGVAGAGLEPFFAFQSEDDVKLSTPLPHQDDRLSQPIESAGKWNIIRRLRKSLTRSGSEFGVQLFGQPLFKICPDTDTLPKPVNDLLVLLWRKGPSTEGVFRRPGSTRSTREIREQLNAGLEVDMGELPVVLLVALLKCFLKELPGSLLVSQRYEAWVKALGADEGPQRSSQIKSVLAELPAHNRLLLGQLLAVLRHVLRHSDTNKMDARNLAVCIAPTLLQLDAATLLEEQKVKLEKVTELTQYLIEHCCELLGENVLHLLGDTDEDNSDYLSSRLQDSAYDSTDPDADGNLAECSGSSAGSSRSLPCSATVPSCSDAVFQAFTKPAFNRRCSEPTLNTLSPPTRVEATTQAGLSCLARSHDDCYLEGRGGYDQEPLKKQISDDSVAGSPSEASDLENGVTPWGHTSCSSTCSLESTASNRSEGSVFGGSPQASPPCSRKWSSMRQPCRGAPGPWTDGRSPAQDSEGKRRSQSVRLDARVSAKTLKKAGGFSFYRRSLTTADEAPGDTPSPREALRGDSRGRLQLRPRPLSAIEVFEPPSYEWAVHSVAPPPYRPLTVQDARCEQGRHLFRQRATSESASTTRRFSQPAFEEHSYAKESYV
ncbi:hypothetical protein NHX12_025737 [Muraenolepis orangiensis]|uniref:Rho-GAP domain-containing protein n=1 Tax=Muraenolepis orangiensis TaxID=630683 RepID=A0A9Q0EDR6_9TELE|nr:hypothetical protein NHX12_025737 [Muraenolepis orangiensis]